MTNEGSTRTVTELLAAARAGDAAAVEQLSERIYKELRARAAWLMRRERTGHTLQPTALVNEALIRLIEADELNDFENRRHLFAAVGNAMKRILVDHANAKNTQKRGGKARRVPLFDAWLAPWEENQIDIIALHEAMQSLAKSDPRMHGFVIQHFFAGRSIKEVAQDHGLSDERVRQIIAAAKKRLLEFIERE